MKDFNNGKREHKTVDEWSADIDKEVNGAIGLWKILPREIFSSKAYRSLSLSERNILHCYLNKVWYSKPDKHSKRRMKHNSSVPENGRNLIVTNNEIKARGGIRSDSTISKARKKLAEIGFLDVIRSGKFPQPGIYAVSERWKRYPDGDYKPTDQRPVSFAPYSRVPGMNGRFIKESPQINDSISDERSITLFPESTIQTGCTGNLINNCTRWSDGVDV